MKIAIALTALVLATTLQANTMVTSETGSLQITDVPADEKQVIPPTFTEGIAAAGSVIGIAKDVVALGEAIYTLVEKGRPKITTEYAPISILPRDPTNTETDPAKKYAVDPFDMEGFSLPVEKMVTTKLKSPFGSEVVTFQYKILYSYGGSYNGRGKYLTGINIIPVKVTAGWGWILNSTMKFSGMMNHGTRENPNVGAIITVKYNMSNLTRGLERNDTIHITGDGKIKAYIAN